MSKLKELVERTKFDAAPDDLTALRAAGLRLAETPVKDTPYAYLVPEPGLEPRDLTMPEREAMARRSVSLQDKVPRYITGQRLELSGGKAEKEAQTNAPDKAQPTTTTTTGGDMTAKKAAKDKAATKKAGGKPSSGLISQETREKMDAAGAGAVAVMEKKRAADAKAAKAKPVKAKRAGADGKPKKKAAAVPRGQGIGAFCEGLLLKGKSTEEVLAAVKEKFPAAKTGPASVAWYRNKLREEGTLPKD